MSLLVPPALDADREEGDLAVDTISGTICSVSTACFKSAATRDGAPATTAPLQADAQQAVASGPSGAQLYNIIVEVIGSSLQQGLATALQLTDKPSAAQLATQRVRRLVDGCRSQAPAAALLLARHVAPSLFHAVKHDEGASFGLSLR